MTAEEGLRLNDRYRLEERIAAGGMGEVWRARDEVLDRDVAVKLLKREYVDDPTFLERFRNEARHAAGLSHPGIAGVFDFGESAGASYLVMELVRGEPLNALIAREGRLSPERTLDVVAQAARALEAAHQGGVIHRDVKPGNILVCPDGIVKITDFGIARAADAVPLTQTGTVMGTAHYVSPEQANGAPLTYASDLYSLGVVAYECLAGRRPFDAETPVGIALAHINEDPLALPEDVPEAVQQLVARSLAKSPDERFVSAAAFAQAADAVRSQIEREPVTETFHESPDPTLTLAAAGATAAFGAEATASAGAVSRDADIYPAPPPLAPTPPPPFVPRRSRGPLALLFTLVVLALLGALVWGALKPAPEQQVPRLRGLSQSAAEKALDARKLGIEVKRAYSGSVRTGVVISQDPEAGATVREGDDVTVTISRGPQPVRLPSGLSGRPVNDVVRDLGKLGLKVTRKGELSAQRFGTVIAVAPTTGLHRGDTVTVRYSLGLPRVDRGEDDEDKKGKGKGDD
ncbi:MAG TPA: protein kinase [Frankiaceae bacterium]|nr:protein kinase [Frankiaceae bacterium]